MTPIPIVNWPGLFDPIGSRGTLGAELPDSVERDAKGGPLWSPIIPNSDPPQRGWDYTAFMTAFVIDLDSGGFEGCLAALEGHELWAYTTWQHEPEAPRWRVVVPFATPVGVERWRRVWRLLRDQYAPEMDRSCCDAGRGYYWPTHAPGAEHCEIWLPGAPLRWDTFQLSDEPEQEGTPLAPGDRYLDGSQVALAVSALAEGFPPLGERHELALAVGGALRRELVCDEQIAQIVELGFAAGGSNAPERHAVTAVQSAANAAAGGPSYGWATIARIIGSELTGRMRKQTSAARQGINVEALRPRPAPAMAWPDPESRSTAPLFCNVKTGVPLPTGANVERILTGHPAWHGVLAYDELAGATVCRRDPPCRPGSYAPAGKWTDVHTTSTVYWLSDFFGIDANKLAVKDAIVTAACRDRYHPVAEYLSSLAWDGTPRLENFLVDYFGVDDSTYARAVGRRWLLSAVARAYRPGCKADAMLVLEGATGIGKSSAGRILCSEQWFSDSKIDWGSKEGPQAMRGRWIIEIPELNGFRQAQMDAVKASLSTQVDYYRESYGQFAQDYPRSSVFVGSTNRERYLTDITGNRRFWPVSCHAIDLAGLARDRDQIWGEAVEQFRAGEQWHLTPDEERLAVGEQSARMMTDPWVDILRDWLTHTKTATFSVTNAMAVLQIPPERQNLTNMQRLNGALRVCGYVPERSGGMGKKEIRYERLLKAV